MELGGPGRKFLSGGVSHEYNVKASLVLLLVDDGSHSSSVVATSCHAKLTDIKLDEILDLSGLQIHHDGVVHLKYTINLSCNKFRVT